MKRVATASILALGLLVGGAATAQAGEYSGKGNPVPGGDQGKSLCSYSGRDVRDNLEGPDNRPDDAITSQRNYVQSYGVFVSLGLKAQQPSPGMLCRGNLVFEE